jgi:EAL domain-containing protein (putative c-di-GMP-specific phosphodiesterase class I)
MPDDEIAVNNLKQLKSLGVRVALDDFGSGYTSFNQLSNYPLDILKVDRSFAKNLQISSLDKKPTLDIIYELAQIYQLDVIVEGVEAQADFEHIKNLGYSLVQGNLFSKPRMWQDLLDGNCNLQQVN